MRVIQVESSLSRTADRAYRWISVRRESESALASGIARVLLEEKLVSGRGPMPEMTLAEAASQTGLDTTAIRELARTIVAKAPVIVIASDNNPAIAALNLVLGAVGSRGGIVRRSKAANAYASADAAIASARAVILDSSVPWNFVPQTDAEVFRFAGWNGGPSQADWLLPAPGFLEELTDVPGAPTSGVETYAVAQKLTSAVHETHSSAEFLAGADSSLTSPEKIIHSRCAELFRTKMGILRSRESSPVAQIASAQKLEEQLRNGAVWVGEPASGESIRCALKQWPAADAGSPSDRCAPWVVPVMPPLATKLYQESGLRESQGRNA